MTGGIVGLQAGGWKGWASDHYDLGPVLRSPRLQESNDQKNTDYVHENRAYDSDCCCSLPVQMRMGVMGLVLPSSDFDLVLPQSRTILLVREGGWGGEGRAR